MHWTRKLVPALYMAAALVLGVLAPRAQAAETDCPIHDPSAIVASDGSYWVFGTGNRINVYSSPDRQHWTRRAPVFATEPAWIVEAVPRHRRNDYWAPDVRLIDGRYCLYYAVSVFGRNTSAIGLATSPSLRTPHWTDQGMVVRSHRTDRFNAIDPCVIQDASGDLWLCFGSFWDGIKLIALDKITGLAMPGTQMVSLAAHPQDTIGSIEAPYLAAHGGYYDLFVNWGLCCRGEKSTYSVLVGRSRAITGPYLDRKGRDMRAGGGSIFLETVGSGPSAHEIGPGQVGIESDGQGDRLSCHYEWAQDYPGRSVLNVFKLAWDADGWPRIASDTGGNSVR